MTFEDLNISKPILNALTELGYIYPTPIQRASYSKIMSGRDVVGIAQTGTGKTFAYLLPLIRMWKFNKNIPPTIIILVPTRELAVQVEEEIKKLTVHINIRTVAVFGGTNINTQGRSVLMGADVVIGTPGRLMDLALNGILKLTLVNKLVIDEVDEMLNLGFRSQLQNIFDLLPVRRQNIMFSATLTKEVSAVIDEYFNSPEKIEIAPSGTPLDQIALSCYEVLNFNTKINLLRYLLKTDAAMEKILVFVASKRLADYVFERLEKDFEGTIEVLHSNKSQNYRFRVVNGFADGSYKILIATDIISRGLDIDGVSHVINMDTPDVAEDFIHRVGRTGRADKAGIAITMTTERELDYLLAIEALMEKQIDRIPLPGDVTINEELIIEEKEVFFQKNYIKAPTLKHSQGAFHEKKEKNKKVNLGGFAKKRAEATKKLGKKYKNTR